MHGKILLGGRDEDYTQRMICVQSIHFKLIIYMWREANWGKCQTAFGSRMKGWADLCLAKIILSKSYLGALRASRICLYRYTLTCGDNYFAVFGFLKHQSRLINHTVWCDPSCNLLITALWVQITDFSLQHHLCTIRQGIAQQHSPG